MLLSLLYPPDQVNEDELIVTGINIGSHPEKNLVMKAVRKMRENYPIPFLKIHLHKAIPHGAGLGGGSSDAACMLKAINKCFSLSMNESDTEKHCS